jgi:hypothetical protein
MQNRDGVQKGPQDHAEGQHGAKTRSKILEQLHSRNGNGVVDPNKVGIEPSKVALDPSKVGLDKIKSLAHHNSAHRLFEERQQHDEAEKNSEKTRLNREIERRHLDPTHIPKI